MKDAFDWDSIAPRGGSTADPAAGASPAAVTVPAGKRWLLLSARTTGNTAVAAANRQPYIQVLHDGTNASYYALQTTAIIASQNAVITCFIPGATSGGSATSSGVWIVGVGAPGIEMAAGAIWQVLVFNIQAADDWGPVYYAYKEAPL